MAYEPADPYGEPGAVPGGNSQVLSADQEAKVEDFKRNALVQQQTEVELVRQLGRKKGEKLAEAAELAQRKVRLTSLSDVVPESTFWLWRNRIPLGEITLVAGKGGIGKSLILCTLTAWITTGTMYGQFYGDPRDVIFIANEDSYEKTVVPRMLAAGADMSRVHRAHLDIGDGVEGKLILPTDCAMLAAAVREVNAVAVILDPLSSNMMDRDRNSPEVRQSYERLRLFADTSNVAVIGNGHTRKGQSADLLEAIMGSSEIGNVARAALGVVRDPDSEEPKIILSQCKNNYGPIDLTSYTYSIQEKEVPGHNFKAPVIVWGEDSERHVNDILSEPTSMVSTSDVKDCVEWLKSYLTMQGRSARKDVMKAAAAEGYKEHTVKRAAPRAGVIVQSSGFPRITSWNIGEPTAPTVSENTDPPAPQGAPTVPTVDYTQDPMEDEDD